MIYIVRGLMYGDEGKGSIVDYLTRLGGSIVKEGGPQAAHHVASKDGKMHRSEQMGSGVFNEGVRTFCSKNMLVHPQNLIMENTMLHMEGVHDGMKRMFIDSRCPIVTPLHQMIGQMKEISRGSNRYGSTGTGVGEAVKDWKEKDNKVLTMGDIYNENLLKEKIDILFSEKLNESKTLVENNSENSELRKLYQYYLNSLSRRLLFSSYWNFSVTYPNCIVYDGDEYLNKIIESENNIICEGSQGALLDPEFGFLPYVTKMKTTFGSAIEMVGNKVSRSEIMKMGVVRAYSTRHGVGPFVTEDKFLTEYRPDRYNGENMWQGKFRIGWFDLLAVKYAIAVNDGVDEIALTCLDRLSQTDVRVCAGYEYTGDDYNGVDDYFEWECAGTKLILTGFKKCNWSTDENISKILFECKPIYRKFDRWNDRIGNVKRFEDLPIEAKKYVKYLEDELNIPISIISVGETSENKIEVE